MVNTIGRSGVVVGSNVMLSMLDSVDSMNPMDSSFPSSIPSVSSHSSYPSDSSKSQSSDSESSSSDDLDSILPSSEVFACFDFTVPKACSILGDYSSSVDL